MPSTEPSPDLPSDNTGSTSEDFAGAVRAEASPARSSRAQIPDAIERHYLRIDDRYFFPDRTLAFIDDGRSIRVRTENLEVLRNVVAIAQARGWQVISLKGTETFRQGMWREAALRGIEAQGYEPTPTEILQVQRMLARRHPSHETGHDPTSPTAASAHETSTAGDHHPDAPDPGQDNRRPREGSRPPIQGMLVAAAAAPYQFDPAQRMSFYATVRTEIGDRTIWGTDLERAFAESTSWPRIGDEVVLTQHGTHPVNVRVAARNMDGEVVAEKKIVVQRARWSVETAAHLRAMERRAEHVRTGAPLSDAFLRQDPVLAAAGAALELASQYTRRVTTDQASQQRLMQLIRERMAEALGQGRSIHLPARRPRATPMPVRARGARSDEERSHDHS